MQCVKRTSGAKHEIQEAFFVSISERLIISLSLLTEMPLASGRLEEHLAADIPSLLIITLSDISSYVIMHPCLSFLPSCLKFISLGPGTNSCHLNNWLCTVIWVHHCCFLFLYRTGAAVLQWASLRLSTGRGEGKEAFLFRETSV